MLQFGQVHFDFMGVWQYYEVLCFNANSVSLDPLENVIKILS